jgi:hypothetical protein
MGEGQKSLNLVDMSKIGSIESQLRHHTLHQLFSRRTLSKGELEIELLPLLRKVSEDKSGNSALEFVSDFTPEDIKKAHDVYPSGMKEAYGKLEKDVRFSFVPGDQLGSMMHVNQTVISFFKPTVQNKEQALAIVGDLVKVLEEKLRS